VDKAIHYLARKGDALALEAALELALLADNAEAELTLASSYANMCLYTTHEFEKAFKLYAKFPSLRKNLYLLGAEQTLWQQGNQHEQEDVAPREELITACFPSANQLFLRLRRDTEEPHFFEKVLLAWQRQSLPLGKQNLETIRNELRAQHFDGKSTVAHSTYLCLALLSFLLDEVENGVRFCLLLLAKVDSLEQIRLFSLCFPKWPTAHHFFY